MIPNLILEGWQVAGGFILLGVLFAIVAWIIRTLGE